MPDTVMIAAIKALEQRLRDAPGLDGIPIERERIAEVDAAPAIVISGGTMRIEDVFTGRSDLTIELVVECFHRAAADETEAEAQEAASALAARVSAAILADRTLGGAADDTAVEAVSVLVLGGDPVAARADVAVTIATGQLVDDPYTRA